MDAVGAAGALVGLAVPIFQCAKALRDTIKTVHYPPYLLSVHAELIPCWCFQIKLEKEEISAFLAQYEEDIESLESLYNDNKVLLDQNHLDTDLKQLGGYVL